METNKELSYQEAISEVEQIVQRMQQNSVDIDQLAAMVERATSLIAKCNEKLKKAQNEVERAVEANQNI